MKCPHCLVAFNDTQSLSKFELDKDTDGYWRVERRTCPECHRFVLHLTKYLKNQYNVERDHKTRMFRPKSSERPCPPEVPKEFAEDYSEACLVLADSAKASAALSRRCLQNLLRDHVKTKNKDLADQIEEVIKENLLPSYLANDLDTVRNIGNFGAHPIKSKQSGEVLPVEAGEAEWNLDVLESLFDFCFVQPAVNQKRRDALNQKLQEAGKPLLK